MHFIIAIAGIVAASFVSAIVCFGITIALLERRRIKQVIKHNRQIVRDELARQKAEGLERNADTNWNQWGK